MENFKQLQLEVEQFFISNNKPFPDGWNWTKEGNEIYFIENVSKRKRRSKLKCCEYCHREFAVGIVKKDTAKTCNRYCHNQYIKNENKKFNVDVTCALCDKSLKKKLSALKNSKSGLYFCDRKCKEEAQKVGGIAAIQPSHYQDGSKAYSERAFKHYGYKCKDCNVTMKAFLHIHHIDSDRDNGSLENLEVVCSTHHMLRHMRYKNKTDEWVVDFKFLTPIDKLDELRKLLTA